VDLPSRRLSRRALMKAAAIAPVIALGRKAWAQPTPANVAQLAAWTKPVPATELNEVLALAETAGADRTKFELVARALWTHFTFGVGNKVTVPDPIFKLGYTHKSGGFLVEHVKKDDFDPLGNDYQTNVCAYICGHHAALIALANGKTAIDEPIYTQAWTQTETEMKQKIQKAEAAMEAMGKTVKPPSLGHGC
jgi:hypothetical protein